MRSAATLWARVGAIEPHWQLGEDVPPGVRTALVGWELEPEPVDAGVPAPVAQVLATAFAGFGRVCFLRSTPMFAETDTWQRVGDDWVRGPVPASGLARLADRFRGLPASPSLVCTRQPATAVAMFTEPALAWWLQSQVVLLGRDDGSAPDLTPALAMACCAPDWTTHVETLRQAGIAALAKPGVDGDVAGLFGFDDTSLAHLLALLSDAAREAGVAWRERD